MSNAELPDTLLARQIVDCLTGRGTLNPESALMEVIPIAGVIATFRADLVSSAGASPWCEAATIVQACLNVHSTYTDAEREFAAHLIEVFKTRDQHPDYKHSNSSRAYPAAPAPSEDGAVVQQVYVSEHPLHLICNKCGLKQVISLQCPREDGQLVSDVGGAVAPSAGLTAIQQERQRQLSVEKWTPEHDDEHEDGELAQAANCYRELGHGSLGQNLPDIDQSDAEMPDGWPWDEDWWKPKTRMRNLVRAGALYQAEIDRLTRRRDQTAEEVNELLAPSAGPTEDKSAGECCVNCGHIGECDENGVCQFQIFIAAAKARYVQQTRPCGCHCVYSRAGE